MMESTLLPSLLAESKQLGERIERKGLRVVEAEVSIID